MKISTSQRGSLHLVAFLAVAVIVAICAVGYKVIKNDETKTAITTTNVRSTAVPKAINSTSEAKKADNALDNTSIDSSVNPEDLDRDIDAL